MKEIYRLRSDVANYSSFIQDYDSSKEESIMSRAARQKWSPFTDYEPIKLKLRASDTGKRNYGFDISGSLFPFYVFSEDAVAVFDRVLRQAGQVLDVITESKKKNFFGFYPTKTFRGCLDLDKSQYRKYSNGFMVNKPVLVSGNLPEDFLFTVEEDRRVFVTSDFKEMVERAGLLAFDFSETVEVS